MLTHIQELLDAAETNPDDTVLILDGVSFSTAEVRRRCEDVARGLVRGGLHGGDRVVIMLPSRPEAVWSWFGTAWAGGIDCPLSPEVKGALLDYYLTDLEPSVVVSDVEGLQKIAACAWVPDLAVVVGEWDGTDILGAGARHLGFEDLAREHPGPDLPLPDADGTGTIIYTSGTTGPPKGVMLSRGYWLEISLNHRRVVRFEPGQRVYGAQPLYHMDARSVVVDCLLSRATLVLASQFSASAFWDEVERYDADVFFFVGTMIHHLYKQPDRQSGRAGRHRLGWGSAIPAALYEAFQERFNVTLVEGYGMTEVPFIASQTIRTASPGNVGHVVGVLETRIVDDTDQPVPDGCSGELLIRPRSPHVMMQGYWRKPEETLEATRGLWFRTGDLVRARTDGALEYVGRRKDSIRRRGENVSAWEVEQAALRQPDVREAAAFGVPAEVGDEDVALLVVPWVGGGDIDLAELRQRLSEDLPRYALPRFVELVDDLPKTPSERIAKGRVRERGLTPAAYDAEGTRV